MFGEITSLWGSVGLADNSAIIAFSITVSVGLAGILSVLAIDRLIDQPTSGILAVLRQAWIVALCGATLATFLWILIAVHIEH